MRTLVIWMVLIAPVTLAACGRGHGRSGVRACFANQKTIAGAMEMYNLDNNLTLDRVLDHFGTGSARIPEEGGTWMRPIPEGYLRKLVEDGYLQSFPTDPGEGPDARNSYWLTGWGNGIFCMRHGEIQPITFDSPPQKQLSDHGVTDAAALGAASGKRPSWAPADRWALLLGLIPLAPAALLGFLISSRGAIWMTVRVIPASICVGIFAASGPPAPDLYLPLYGVAMAGTYVTMGALAAAALRGLGRVIVPGTRLSFVATKGTRS